MFSKINELYTNNAGGDSSSRHHDLSARVEETKGSSVNNQACYKTDKKGVMYQLITIPSNRRGVTEKADIL